jgi:hypothetical protein
LRASRATPGIASARSSAQMSAADFRPADFALIRLAKLAQNDWTPATFVAGAFNLPVLPKGYSIGPGGKASQ